MSSVSLFLIEGAARMFSRSHPAFATLVETAIAHEDQLEKLGPVIAAAAKEGPGAFQAAVDHAPELANAIKNFVHSLPGTAPSQAAMDTQLQKSTENATRDLFHLPHMTADQEREWMDRFTPANQDSRFGGG